MALNPQHKAGVKLIDRLFQDEYTNASKMRLAAMVEAHRSQPRALRRHTHAVIYPLLAAVLVRTEAGVDQAEAVAEVSGKYFEHFVRPTKRMMRKLIRLPYAYKLFIPLSKAVMRGLYGTEAGFENEVRASGRRRFRYDVLVCPYHEACKAYGVPELTDTFCTTDDLIYGDLHAKIIFERNGTLARAADRCDFSFRERN